MPTFPDLEKRLETFKKYVLPAKSVLIVTHDYPDPDCLASAAGLANLLNFWGVDKVVITHGGFVGRAENRAMVRLLDLRLVPILLVEPKNFDSIVLVDAVPGGGNVSLPADTPLDAVFDHHMSPADESVPCYWDVRPDIGATSTIVTMYLLQAKCPIPTKLATALFYGIKTDTGDMGREAFPEDLSCYKILFDHMDHKILARIERPPRGMEFYECLYRALQSFALFGSVGMVNLGHISTPDYVAEMADFFHSLESLEWTVCSGIFESSLFYSVRSKEINEAGRIATRIGKEMGGSGGGHGKIGAGRVDYDDGRRQEQLARLEKSVRKILGVKRQAEKPFVGQSTPESGSNRQKR
ncbi:MAG: DHH family phosphoesterase [Desulfatibacillaceae bacterium]